MRVSRLAKYTRSVSPGQFVEMTLNLFDLTGHVALITGGNGGIGFGYACGLARCGATLAIWGTNAAKNQAAVERLSAFGVEVQAICCDVGDEQLTRSAVAETLRTFGRIDSCFVNAGVIGRSRGFNEMPVEEWRRVIRVNLDGAFFTAQSVVKHWVERWNDGDQSGASMVFTSSGAGVFGQSRGEHYGASKAGTIAMSRSIALEFARFNIRSNAIVPGLIKTDMSARAFQNEAFARNMMSRIPVRRWGDPEDFGAIAAYLASPASRYHTGDILTVDGGFYIS